MTARYEVHRFIQALARDATLRERFQADREAAMSGFALSEGERDLLKDGSPPALARLGVHPLLQIPFMIFSNPEMAAHITVRDYLSDLT